MALTDNERAELTDSQLDRASNMALGINRKRFKEIRAEDRERSDAEIRELLDARRDKARAAAQALIDKGTADLAAIPE